MVLYRPVGKKEYDLIKENNFEKFPRFERKGGRR
jgi:hypothetical protein